MAVRLSALCTGCPLPPRKIPGTHLCLRLSRLQGHSAAGRIRSIEKIHLTGNQTRDLPACSIVPQPTMLPRAPIQEMNAWRNLRLINTQILYETIEYLINCVTKGYKPERSSSQEPTMDREHNSPSTSCKQAWSQFHRLQQEHITAFGAHQFSVLTKLHASLQLWMQYKVRHKLTSCLKFQNSTRRTLPLASLGPFSADLGDAPSWDVLLH
jgi:hypothetical protein